MKQGLIILIFYLFGFILGCSVGSEEEIAIDKNASSSAIAGKEKAPMVHGQGMGEIITGKIEEPTGTDVDKQEAPPVNGEEKRENKTVEHTFKRGDTFYGVLLGLGVPPREVFSLIESGKGIHNFKRVTTGTTMSLEIDPVQNIVTRLEFCCDNRHLVIVTKTDQGYVASKEEIVFDTRLRTVGGVIRSNLYEDATKAGCGPQLILNFADVFAWDIDFFSDLRKNDSFRIVFEEMYKDGEFVKYGKIVAAQFINRKHPFRAFYFDCGNGDAGYYDDDGKSVVREFLKSPLRFSRISSRFSRRRFHPVLRIYRPHSGVDYAAPRGTPVEATCNGKIIFIGWKGGYGKCIIVKHNHTYTSYYGHLSRFARGMKKGKRVKQGRVIGYVGATGLATGPHLDYRLKKRRVFIDPLKYKSPRMRSLSKALLPEFEACKRQMSAMLFSPFSLPENVDLSYGFSKPVL
ncbi:MAG: peptidoglycan DD-metalloendopeptidase family protein [Deltaproteobacteria bacterium]|nr:peptidoglycan DD-metalloendopeptidase family protein [Deltaproteobacteria bacterium]